MKKRLFGSALKIILSILLITGCGRNSEGSQRGTRKTGGENGAERQKLTVGFSIDTLAIERWQRDLDVFVNRTKELGANVIVQNAGNSVEEQNRQILYLMDRNVDVIVLLPKDAEGMSESLQKVKEKNIPVISYDRLIRNADVDLYLSIDSEKVGELMAKQMMQITEATEWNCILGDRNDYNMTLIELGLRKQIFGTPIRITHTFYTEGWNYDLAYEETVNLITAGKIPGAFICGNDAVADSVIAALNIYYPDHNLPLCGQDAEIAACQNIVNGRQSFTIYKPISKLAEMAAEYAVRVSKGSDIKELTQDFDLIDNGYKNVPALWLEPEIVTKENLDQVIIDSGFHTRNEIYRENH